ncbi:MAG: cytochrome c nitrite reductase small subunit [Armatimonadetes bacterium]|nr:cytochrome c nitrite reductase small subunit [Armatimonadota bacterium]
MGWLERARIGLGVMIGLAIGVGGYTFIYANGASYMTNNPEACLNCHVMREQFDGWTRSSHHAVAVCNDCHTPHNLVGKYLTKASNGWHHSVAFTTGRFHEPIMITERNRKVTEEACRHCHEDIVQAIDAVHQPSQTLSCVRCHQDVGHLH